MARQPNFPLKIKVPGAYGITGESSISGEVPEWLLLADNAVFSREGLIAPRQLFREIPDSTLLTPFTDITLSQTAQFLKSADVLFINVQDNGELYAFQSGSPIELTALPDDGVTAAPTVGIRGAMSIVYLQRKWYFFDFNTAPSVWDSVNSQYSGLVAGPPAVGSTYVAIAHSAFGRLWGAHSNGRTLYWSVLLDGTDWTGVGSGSLDLSSYLSNGEYITAIADFNNYLIVFTATSTLIFKDPFTVPIDSSGTEGAEESMSLKEQIHGVGCVGKNAWANVGEEIYFVSRGSLRRLSRVIQEGGSNPVGAVVDQLNPFLEGHGTFGLSLDGVRLNYLPWNKALALDYNAQVTFFIWLDRPIGDNSYAVTHMGTYGADLHTDSYTSPPTKFILNPVEFTFFGYSLPCLVVWYREYDETATQVYNNLAFMPLRSGLDDDGEVDLAETEYTFKLRSAWLNFGDGNDAITKIMKDLHMIYRTPMSPYAEGATYVSEALEITYRLRFDYGSTPKEHVFTTPLVERGSTVSPYHTLSPHTVSKIPLSGSGSSVQWEIEAQIDNRAHEFFAIQNTGFSVKLGRINQGI